MKKPSARVLTLMTEAAQLRALGITWKSIAAHLGCSERSCRRWTEAHPGVWNRLLTRMEDQALREAGAEALHVLKRALVGKAQPLPIRAAQFLYGKLCEVKRRRRRPKDAANARYAKYVPFIAYLESLDENQRKALVTESVARSVAESKPAEPAGGGRPGPAVGE